MARLLVGAAMTSKVDLIHRSCGNSYAHASHYYREGRQDYRCLGVGPDPSSEVGPGPLFPGGFWHLLNHWIGPRGGGCWHTFYKDDGPARARHGPFEPSRSERHLPEPPPPLPPLPNWLRCCQCGRERRRLG